MCALFLRGVRGHAGARRRQQVGEVVCAIRSARRARQVDVDVGGLLLRPTDRRRRCGADSAGAVEKALDKKSDESTSTAAPPAEAQAEGAVEKAPDKKRSTVGLTVRLSSRWLGSAPADKTFAYSEADWQSIKASPGRVGIDADAVTVGDHWWAQPDPAAALAAALQRPLREQLQELAAAYRGLAAYCKQGEALTPLQEAGEIQEKLKKLEAARAALDSRLLDFIPRTPDAREALTVVIAHAKRHVNLLRAEGSRSSLNACKVHFEYWDKLTLLWQAITANQNRRPRGRGLNSFLLACSKSVFPDETSKSNIKNFRQNVRRKGVNDRRKSGVVLPF